MHDVGVEFGLSAEQVDNLIHLGVDSDDVTDVPSEAIQTLLERNGVPTYPYRYPGIDEYVDVWLTPDLVMARPELVVDLASLFVMYAMADTYGIPQARFIAPALVGYSLMRRTAEIVDNCDVRIQLELITALGGQAPVDLVSELADSAMAVCPGDPAPLWILGKLASAQTSLTITGLETNHTPGDLARVAEEAFARLAAQFPTSPLGKAASADTMLELADEGEAVGGVPFTVNRLRQDALNLYSGARLISDDPGLLAGQARALSGLGRHEEAARLIDAARSADPDNAAFLILQVDILTRGGRFLEAADVAAESSSMALPTGREVIPQGEGPELGFGTTDALGLAIEDLTSNPAGGADISDFAFLPRSRGDWASGWCLVDARQTALILGGRPLDALTLYDRGEPLGAYDSRHDCSLQIYEPTNIPTDLQAIAAAEAGDQDRFLSEIEAWFNESVPYADIVPSISSTWDRRQDMWRWAGDLDKALIVIEQWQREFPSDPWAVAREGEVLFLRREYEPAAAAFKEATHLLDQLARSPMSEAYSLEYSCCGPDDMSFDEYRQLFTLQRGTALKESGQRSEARQALLAAAEPASATATWGEWCEFHALAELGQLSLRGGEEDDAVFFLAQAVAIGQTQWWESVATEPHGGTQVLADGFGLHGAEENNLALAYASRGRKGDAELAIEVALDAVAHDPHNPVFLDTLAFAYQSAGDAERASLTYAKVIRADPSSYVSLNNAAVLAANAGDAATAVSLLRQAVAVAPDYALGWHNLGTVRRGQGGIGHFLLSESDLARAGRIDRTYRGADLVLQMDRNVYTSGVDVSKPVPATWRYTDTATDPVNPFTVTMLLAILLRIAWLVGLDRLTGRASEFLVRPHLRRGPLTSPSSWVVGAAAAVVVLVIRPLLSGQSAVEALFTVAGAVALISVPLVVRHLVAQRMRARTVHYTWAPSLVAAGIGTPLGVLFAPLPVVNDALGPPSRRARLLGLLAAISVAVLLSVVALLTAEPGTRQLAGSALVVVGSLAVPVLPFDGSSITSKAANSILTAALVVGTLALAMGWV